MHSYLYRSQTLVHNLKHCEMINKHASCSVPRRSEAELRTDRRWDRLLRVQPLEKAGSGRSSLRPYHAEWVEGLLVTQSSCVPPTAVLTPAKASVPVISSANSAQLSAGPGGRGRVRARLGCWVRPLGTELPPNPARTGPEPPRPISKAQKRPSLGPGFLGKKESGK